MSVVNLGAVMWVPPNDEEALKNAVAVYGPIAVAINASRTFMYYR
jgi:hypothetical protein